MRQRVAVLAAGVAMILGLGFGLHFGAGLNVGDSAGVVTVALTVVAIAIAALAARYAAASARASRDAVAPLEATASTLSRLAEREESVVRALENQLREAERQERRRELFDELRLLREMSHDVEVMRLAVEYDRNPEAFERFVAAMADYRAHSRSFRPGTLGEPVEALAGYALVSWGAAPTGAVSISLDDEVHRRLNELESLSEPGKV